MADHAVADWPGIAAAMTAGSAILFGIGKGIAWVMKHSRSRVTSLEARIDDLEAKYQKLWLAFGFVATGLHARDPLDRNLRQAATILGDAFPLDMYTPKDMEEVLSKIP
jgi:hypothetical protein